jgi:hypothetical protein
MYVYIQLKSSDQLPADDPRALFECLLELSITNRMKNGTRDNIMHRQGS